MFCCWFTSYILFLFLFLFLFWIYIFILYIYIPTTSLILRFTIYISLRHIPKYTLRKVIISHYHFLSSKAYQKRYYVIEIGPGVPGSVRWIVDLKGLSPRSRILDPGSWFWVLHFRLCRNETWIIRHSSNEELFFELLLMRYKGQFATRQQNIHYTSYHWLQRAVTC